jgi:hypothetical protein
MTEAPLRAAGSTRTARWLVAAALALAPAAALAGAAATPGAAFPIAAVAAPDHCPVGGVEMDLAGSGDTAVVSGRATEACNSGPRARHASGRPGPFFTDELVCSVDRARAAEGLCSTTPCMGGLFFALRTLHRTDGTTEPAGSTCVSLNQARASPTLTAADVFAAIRGIRLPPGTIRVNPSGRGLANLPTRVQLSGDAQPPVDLDLAGSVIHAEFEPVGHRWAATPASPDRGRAASYHPGGRGAAASMEFTDRGEFAISVVTTWSAAAYLDGRYVGRVDDLSSTARTTYVVAELRTSLSG